jgi:hypothetical protein
MRRVGRCQRRSAEANQEAAIHPAGLPFAAEDIAWFAQQSGIRPQSGFGARQGYQRRSRASPASAALDSRGFHKRRQSAPRTGEVISLEQSFYREEER